MPQDDIKWLARKAAHSGLKLAAARDLFTALYIADALAMEGGSMTRAAKRAGVSSHATLRRSLKRSAQTEGDEG